MEEMARRSQARPPAGAAVTGELVARFTAFLDVRPKTVETYTRALRQMFRFLSERDIRQPGREDLIAWREDLRARCKPATVQNYVIAARLFFRWTAQEHLYPDIADHLKGASISREHKKDYLTSGQVKAVLGGIDRSGLPGLRDWAVIALMVTGGLRTIEVVRADLQDLGTVGDCPVLFIQGKGQDEKAAYVKLQPPVEEGLRAYLLARGPVGGASPLFASVSRRNRGGRLTTRAVSGIVKGRLRAAGYDSRRLTAHSLRHTAVTLSLLGGNSIEEVQQFARHRNIATTQIYAHHLDREKNRCEETISKALF